MTSLLAFVSLTLVLWLSKRQGSIASSMYATEFSALCIMIEEAIALRYMLRCLSCNLPTEGNHPTCIFGGNMSVIQSALNPQADLSKKHIAVSSHVVCEAIAARIIKAYWLQGEHNMSDILTKQIPCAEFIKHCKHIFWSAQFYVLTHNDLSLV